MKEILNTNSALTSTERIKRLVMQYNDDYPQKPAPLSLESIADNRHKIPTLHQIRVHRGFYVVEIVSACIEEILSKFLNIKRGMDAPMIAATAELVCQRFPSMTPADVKLFMTKGVMGEYGQILDRVDGSVIMSWASQYWDHMKHLIKLRQPNQEKDDPKCPVPELIAQLSERLRAKQELKKSTVVIPRGRPSLKEEYARRGFDLDEIINEK